MDVSCAKQLSATIEELCPQRDQRRLLGMTILDTGPPSVHSQGQENARCDYYSFGGYSPYPSIASLHLVGLQSPMVLAAL